jgi:hypothetical protein
VISSRGPPDETAAEVATKPSKRWRSAASGPPRCAGALAPEQLGPNPVACGGLYCLVELAWGSEHRLTISEDT